MTTTRFCCCGDNGGGGGGDPCDFEVGVQFESTFNATQYTNSAVNTTGGDLTVSDDVETLVYDDITVPTEPGWYGSVSESWSLTDFTIGQSDFDGFSQSNTYSIRLVKQPNSSALSVWSPTIGTGNSKITINSTNDAGYAIFVRSLLHSEFNGTVYSSVPMSVGGCPILPISKAGLGVRLVEVKYRNAFGQFVTNTNPVTSQFFSYSGFGHTLELSEI